MKLVNSLHADYDAVCAAAQDMAREIAANAPLTVQGTKEVLNYSQDKPVADGLKYVAAWNCAFLASEDLGEAVSAFVNKRSPVFKGR